MTDTSGGTATSFTNTPQAKDDSYSYIEDLLWADTTLYDASTGTILLDVMANDSGGKAKSLFSIEDGDGNALTSDFELLCKDVNGSGASPWELTLNGNWVRINNGKIEYRIADGSGIPGQGRDINSLADGELFADEFVYAIRLGNGTLSQATVKINITGANDAASISEAPGGVYNVVEAGGVENGTPGDPVAGGTLVTSDADLGEDKFQAPAAASLEGAYGTFTFDPDTGAWTYVLDNDRAATQSLDDGDVRTETLTVKSFDGTATHTITVTVAGTDDQPTLGAVTAGSIAEVDQSSSTTEDGLSGTLAGDDVDGDALAYGIQGGVADASQPGYDIAKAGAYGTLYVNSSTGAYLFVADADAIEGLDDGDTDSDAFTVTVSDGDGDPVTRTYTVNVSGADDAPVAVDDTGAGDEDTLITGSVALNDSDVDDEASLSYALNGTAPAGFTLNPNGSWSLDASDAAYQHLAAGATTDVVVSYTVSDGLGGSDTGELTITVTGVNDAPVITSDGGGDSASVSIAENTTAVTTAAATDVDSATVTYSIAGGDDAALFTIDAATGALSFVSARDYENPTDADGDNVYDVVVRASDGDLHDDQAIAVTVTDVEEAPSRVAPTDIKLTPATPEDNVNFNQFDFSALLTATDPDPGAFTYSIVSQSIANKFTISGNTLSANDIGTQTTLMVTVRATQAGDPAGVYTEETFTIMTGTNGNSGEELAGVGGDDVLYGNDGADMLFGLAGNDTLFGQAGNDQLHGGDGDDLLNAGSGADTLTGGAGNDMFVLTDARSFDTLTDYEEGEVIDLTSIFTRSGSLDGFVRLTAAGELQIDVNGGGNSYVTVAHILTADADATITYSTGPGTTATAVIARGAPPVALDLNGDGVVSFIGTDAGTTFDYGGGAVATAWVGSQDGLLVRDANHDGNVTADELVFATTGSDLEGLQIHDSNGDGLLSAEDGAFGEFAAWRDANSNGRVDEGEMQSLTALGIASISLTSDGVSYSAAGGDVTVVGTGSFAWADGSTGVLADAVFATGELAAGEQQRTASAATSNPLLTTAAVAAAGLFAASAAASIQFDIREGPGEHFPQFRGAEFASIVKGAAGNEARPSLAEDMLNAGPIDDLLSLTTATVWTDPTAATGAAADDVSAELLRGTEIPMHWFVADDSFVVSSVAVPSAVQLQEFGLGNDATGAGGGRQGTAEVSRVIADAFDAGHSDQAQSLEPLLEALSRGAAEGPTLENAAMPLHARAPWSVHDDTLPEWGFEAWIALDPLI